MKVMRRIEAWWGHSIQRRFLNVTLGLVGSSLTLLGVLSYYTTRQAMLEQATTTVQQMSATVARQVNGLYEGLTGPLLTVQAELHKPADTLTDDAHTLLHLRLSFPACRALYLLDEEGALLLYLDEPLAEIQSLEAAEIVGRPAVPLPEAARQVGESARQQGKAVLSPPEIAGSDRVPLLYTGAPLAGGWVLVAEVALSDFWPRLDRFQIGETGHVVLVSGEGLILAHPDRRYIGRTVVPELAPLLEGYAGQARYQDPLSGRWMVGFYYPAGGPSWWGVVFEQEQADLLAPANRVAAVSLSILVGTTALASLIAVLAARGIARPLQELATAARQAGADDSSLILPAGGGTREVNYLAETLRQTLKDLHGSEEKLQAYAKGLEEEVGRRTKELRQAQEQLLRQERLALLGQLAGGIGHELRNPLGAISNCLYLLRSTLNLEDPQVGEVLEILEQEVASATRTIQSLLDYARPKPPLHRPVHLGDLVQRALHEETIPPTVTVEPHLPPDLPPLHADPDQLLLVFGNLIRNAVQAMPEGGVLSIRARSRDNGVEVAFQDTGEGIPAEHLSHLFEPLFTTRSWGIGLGLALVKLLVEAHGGSVAVESEPGRGSTFTLFLPLGGEET